jgi:hypothetical protein
MTRPSNSVLTAPLTVKGAYKQVSRMLGRIRSVTMQADAAERSGNATGCKRLRRKARFLSQTLTTSYSGKLVAVIRAYKNPRFAQQAPSLPEMMQIAASVSMVDTGTEELRIKAVDKKTYPEFRAIVALGPIETARQYLVDMALKAQLPVLPNQFLTRHGGRHAAVGQVRELMASGRYRFAVTLDLKDFYPSLDREWLVSHLPVGERVSRNAIFLENFHRRARVSGYGLYRHALSAHPVLVRSQLGLLQGAASSPTISEAIIADVVRRLVLAEGVALVNYADNFVLLANSREQLEAAVQSLQDAFARHPAGELRLLSDGVKRLCDGVVFLGYKHKRVKGKVTCVPLEKNTSKFLHRVRHLALRVLVNGADPLCLRRYVLSWASAFRDWECRFSFVMQALRPLVQVPAFRSVYSALLERGRLQFDRLEAEAQRKCANA